MSENKEDKSWRDGVYLTTASTSFEADILESKLRSEGIPAEKKFKGASNAMEILMGKNYSFPIEIYVPEERLEDAKNIIIPVPLTDEDFDQIDQANQVDSADQMDEPDQTGEDD